MTSILKKMNLSISNIQAYCVFAQNVQNNITKIQMNSQQKKLTNQLIAQMKGMGFESTLKTQIRVQLCQKLKEKSQLRDKDINSHDDRLFSRILASMVAQQLSTSKCQYTRSVYSAESGYDEKMLSRTEMTQILGISEQQNDRNSNLNPKFSIIGNLLLKKYPFSGGTFRNTSVQTNPEETGFTLEQRLAKIDMDYRKDLLKENRPINTADEIKEKVKIIEQQLQRNYRKDIERFKEFESHAIKINVSQQWRMKFEEYSKKLQTDYQHKFRHLRNKYKNIEDDLVNRTKVFDEKSATATKNLTQKVQLLEIKNKTLDETKKNLELERKRAKEEYQAHHKELKQKISEYDSLLLKTNKKIEYQVSVAKLAIQQEYQQKQSQFLQKKKFIDEEYGKLMGIKDTMDLIKQQNNNLTGQNTTLRQDLRVIEQELRIAVSENGSKSDRIDKLKVELMELKEQFQELKNSHIQEIKRKKKLERDLTQTRKQIEELRKWKQSNMQESISELSNSDAFMEKTQIEQRFQALKQQRRKQIEKLKLEL